MTSISKRAGKHGRCPICGVPGTPVYRPFCSRRCADVDLSGWLGGNYAISGDADVDRNNQDQRSADQAEASGVDQVTRGGVAPSGVGDRRYKPSGHS